VSNPYKILVVDDTDEVRAFLTMLLRQEGYEVSEASNGKEAQARCGENVIDLIVMDIMMPEQEGLETIRAVRRNSPEIPVIAISGSGDQYLDIAKRFGAKMAFAKPIQADSILSAIRKLVQPQADSAPSP